MKAWKISHKTGIKSVNCRFGIISLPHITTDEERRNFFDKCGFITKEIEIEDESAISKLEEPLPTEISPSVTQPPQPATQEHSLDDAAKIAMGITKKIPKGKRGK